MAGALDFLKQAVSPGSVAGQIRDRNAANAAAANAAGNEGAVAPVVPAGAPMVQGASSPMEMAVRAKLKSAQDARLQQLLQQRGVGAAAAPGAPVINADPNLIR